MASQALLKIVILIALFVTILKMSMQRLAIVTAIGTHMSMKNRTNDIRLNKNPSVETQRPNGTAFHGDVNMVLGGAMLSVVMTIVCVVCYCCHRNKQRTDAVYRQRWLEVDPNMDIYSVEQYYDISANLVTDSDQYTRIMRNHGPPPSYEIAVAMKNPITAMKCRWCQNRIRLSCSCDSHMKSSLQCDMDGQDIAMPEATNELFNIRQIAHQESCGRSKSENMNPLQCYEFTKTCQCDEEMPPKNNHLNEEDAQNGNSYEGHCQCHNQDNYDNNVIIAKNGGGGKDAQNLHSNNNNNDTNEIVPSTSGDINCFRNIDVNSNFKENNDEIDDEDGEFDSLNENGLIRVNMSQIIDQTGLPTYEAALKLESSGYV